MDEATFKKYGLDKRVKVRKSRCQIKPYGAASKANTLPVLGCFEALTESKTKMKVITWQLIKGDTRTEPLLGYNDARDLGMILVTNSIATESNQSEGTDNLNEVLEKYKDRFQGIEACSLQEVNPVGQSHNRPLKTVLISGVDITVLPDSGATVNAMDEPTFKKYGLDKRVKVRKSRCQIKPYGAAPCF